ncbi:MAG: hypothetical protein ABI627_01205 [Polyangiaceae bacterium]
MRRTAISLLGTFLILGLAPREGLADAAVPITAARVNGVYQAAENKLSLLSLGRGKVRVEFDLNNMAAAGYALGDATLAADTLTYTEPPNGPSCKTLIKLLPEGQLDVGVYADCAFGPHTGASGSYRKLKGGVPKFKSNVAVASGGPTPEGAAANVPVSLDTLENTVRLDTIDAAELASLTANTLASITPLAARRTQALNALTAEQAECTKHAAAAAAGYQKHHAGVSKAANHSAAVEGLTVARAEAAQASTQGRALTTKLSALHALDEELFQLSSKAAALALEAGASAKDAQSVNTTLQTAARSKGPSDGLRAEGAETQREANNAKAAATAANVDAAKALRVAGLGPLSGHAANNTRARQEDDKLQRVIAQNGTTLSQIESALKPAASSTVIAGESELASTDVRRQYGAMADETMRAHPEILSAMKAFDPTADELSLPNDNRAVRLTGGREFLLLSGRTCRACAAVGYWVAWEAKSQLVAFVRDDTNVPMYGKPDATLRAVLKQFVKQQTLP